ncbi:hypothetical protein K474DRAFT_1659718 [Panus rudis PR-1116 ss-1]|nr:hypothetical protein K474DRAFT_1659718 [Panus rudis PR-1116 ss-1]
MRKPVPQLQEESPDVKVTPPATPVRGSQATSGVLSQDPDASRSHSSDASGVVFVHGSGFELVAPPVAHCPGSDLRLSLDRPELFHASRTRRVRLVRQLRSLGSD